MRTLWVEDQYALRCRGCDARFNILRRRHHCRNCGQVFCGSCLIAPSALFFAGIVADVVEVRPRPTVKLCKVCDRILKLRGGPGGGGGNESLFHPTKLLTYSPVGRETTSTVTREGKKIINETHATFEKDAGQVGSPLLPPSEGDVISLNSVVRAADDELVLKRVPTHPEGVEEQEISYGLTDTPLFTRNTLSEWLSALLNNSRKVRLSEFQQMPEFDSLIHTYTPFPKATFRVAANSQLRWNFANVFSIDVLTDGLRRFERQVSLHLIKRASRLFAKDDVLSLLPSDINSNNNNNNSNSGSDNNISVVKETNRAQWIAGICDISWRVVSQTAISLKQHVTSHFDVICIPGDRFGDTKIITGVAFLQTIAFKRMKTYVESPKILLLEGDVGISMNSKASLLEYIEGNEGYLDKQFQRICIWRPCVIVVEGSMHHYLQKRILCESNAILILNVGKTVIYRLSKCCNATVIRDLQYVSIVDLYANSMLGSCDSFELLHYGDKPICVFNCLAVPLFTTVILRGAEEIQLIAAKKLLFNCVTTAYHLCIQAHCMFDLGMLGTNLQSSVVFNKTNLPFEEASYEKSENKEEEDDVLPPWGGEPSLSNCGKCDEYMQLITCSPREEDRIETLSMNTAVIFPNELLEISDEYDELMTDGIVVNTISLESVLSGFGGEDVSSSSNAAGGNGNFNGQTSTSGRHQFNEMLYFYGDGDETLFDYLIGRAKECDSMRLIVHCNKRIWVKTTTTTTSEPSPLLTRRINFESGDLLCSHELTQKFFAPNSAGKIRNESYSFLIWCYASCKKCFSNVDGGVTTTRTPLGSPCSLHTLNISWGTFLEFVIYGAADINLSCGHSINPDICMSFFFFPRNGPIVTVNFIVEPLIVYNIITPPVTMMQGADFVNKPHIINEEIEELQRYLVSVVATVKTLTELQTQPPALPQQQQQLQPLGSASMKNQPKSSFSSLLTLRGFGAALDTAGIVGDEKAKELVRTAEDIFLKLSSLDTMEAVTALRLGTLAKLMVDFVDWYKAGVAALERRGGKNSALPEAASFEDNNWAFDAKNNCGVRLNEPTCLVASALQAFSFFSANQPEVLSGNLNSKPHHRQVSGETSSENADDYGESTAFAEGQNNILNEASIEFMLGIGRDLPPTNDQPSFYSSLFIRSSSDAVNILNRQSAVDKRTFKYVMNVQIPWDKTEDITVKVEVMFPEQFAALQYLYTKGHVADMLLSLSRCRAFKSEGGKTKSDFFVTFDERFLLKQIKQTELKHFAEFSSNYFSHFSQMYSNLESNGVNNDYCQQCSSVLAKVFGVFSLHIKRKKRVMEIPGEMRYFVLMENVFFSRCVDVTYDLKGSQRNRTAVEGSSVLLDQDLLGTLRKGDFFYCTNGVKSFLMDSIICDAYLLSGSFIMDYSLLAGLNRSMCNLYLGIVDYLHPYTGAKVLESKVKAGLETMLGHTGRDPTIIDPVSYRVRFTKWMDGCFCGVPEKSFVVKRFLAKNKKEKKKKK